MEPDNIEKLVKDVFAERAIEPSLQARERFIYGLNTKPKKKRAPGFKYAIAAVLVIGLCILGFQTFSNDLNSKEPTNVTFQNEKPAVNEAEKPSDTTLLNQNAKEYTYIKKTPIINIIKTKNKAFVSNGNPHEILKAHIIKENNELTHIEVEPKIVLNSIKKDSSFSKRLIKNAFVKKIIQDQFSYVTPLELLSIVESDTAKTLLKRTKKIEENYVTSNMLLLEMERQLFNEENKSIFKKAGKQLKRLKTSLADRNFKN